MTRQFSKTQLLLTYVLKVIVTLSALTGVILSAYAGRRVFMGGRTVFMFFTIQSNIAALLTSVIGAVLIKLGKVSPVWYIIKFTVTVSITLTGVVFCFILAPTMRESAWNIQNVLTHVVVPAAAVIDFFVTGINSDIAKKNILWVIVPPLLYAVYAGICYVQGREFIEGQNYPYFFLNWGSPAGAFGFTDSLPYMGCVWWILLLLAFLLAIARIYLLIADILKKSVQNKT